MTISDVERKAGFVELAATPSGFAVLWHVGVTVTNVAESESFSAVAERAEAWSISEGVPLVRRAH